MEIGQLVAVITNSVFVLFFIIFGIILWHGKGSVLIAGYNTASPQERSKYDQKALCRGVGGLMFLLAGCYAVSTLGTALGSMALVWTGIVLVVVAIIAGAIFINVSKRFRKK